MSLAPDSKSYNLAIFFVEFYMVILVLFALSSQIDVFVYQSGLRDHTSKDCAWLNGLDCVTDPT